jgi:hypothetical protein
VSPLSVALQRLMNDHSDLISVEVRRYIRDVLDHNIAAADRVATYDEMLTSMVHAAVGRVAMQQNIDMRKISAFVAIAAVPTMVAGIYGIELRIHARAAVEVGLSGGIGADAHRMRLPVHHLPAQALAVAARALRRSLGSGWNAQICTGVGVEDRDLGGVERQPPSVSTMSAFTSNVSARRRW